MNNASRFFEDALRRRMALERGDALHTIDDLERELHAFGQEWVNETRFTLGELRAAIEAWPAARMHDGEADRWEALVIRARRMTRRATQPRRGDARDVAAEILCELGDLEMGR